jgi:hypothetical protein
MALIADWSEGQAMFNHLETSWSEQRQFHFLIEDDEKFRLEAHIINTRAFLQLNRTRDSLRSLNVMLSCLQFLVTQALIKIHYITSQ